MSPFLLFFFIEVFPKSDSGFIPRYHYLATVGLNPADHHYTQRSLFKNCGSEPSSVYIVFWVYTRRPTFVMCGFGPSSCFIVLCGTEPSTITKLHRLQYQFLLRLFSVNCESKPRVHHLKFQSSTSL